MPCRTPSLRNLGGGHAQDPVHGPHHYGQRSIISPKFGNPRPFETIEAHDEAEVALWSAVVRPDDIVWHLGNSAYTRRIEEPGLLAAGRSDWGPFQAPGALERMGARASTHFQDCHFVEVAGHWVQQEQPQAVSDLLLESFRHPAAGASHRT